MAQSYQLVMESGPTPGKIFDLPIPEGYIGRDISNDIVINDAEVSRKHVHLTQQSGGYVLENLGSTNGTIINGQRITGHYVLQDGDTVMLGANVVLTYSAVTFDPDMTAIAAPPEIPEPVIAESQPAATISDYEDPEPTPMMQPPAPGYAGQVAQGPDDFEDAPPASGRNKKPLILGGCGCLVLIACVAVVAVVWFLPADTWCQILPFMGGC